MEDRKFLRRITFPTMAIFILLFASSCIGEPQRMLFHDKEIKGSVVDVETGKPIAGAIIIGMWPLVQVLSEASGGYAKILMTRADKEGNFTIPKWTTFKPWKLDSVMHELAPTIVIYKPGYKIYSSHKIARAGYPDDMSMTDEEKKKTKEENSITPAKLKGVHTDEEIWENHKEFRSQADFPDKHYSKKQRENILNALKEMALQLPSENNKSREKLLGGVRKDWGYWVDE